jgi:hypothetical protein
MFTCTQHKELFEEFKNLDQAMNSRAYTLFSANHMQCGNINILPVEATHKTIIKCNECQFKQCIEAKKTTTRIQEEVFNCTHSLQSALYRSTPEDKMCKATCHICILRNKDKFISDSKGTHYRLLPFDCKTKGVIYIISCTHCNQYYVGLTKRSLNSRLSTHLSSIRNYQSTSIAKHFNSPGHIVKDHFRIGIIDHVTDDYSNLQIREAFWIFQLKSAISGINIKDETRIQLEYQALNVVNHFKHSPSCFPYLISRLMTVNTLALKQYKRLPWCGRGKR